MAGKVPSSFCLFCFKDISLYKNKNTNNSAVKIKRFFKLLSNLVLDESVQNVLRMKADNVTYIRKILRSCVQCGVIIDKFCELNHQVKGVEVEFDQNIDKLVRSIELADGISTRCINKDKTLELKFPGDIKKIKECQNFIRVIRQSVINSSLQGAAKCHPQFLVKWSNDKCNGHHNKPSNSSDQIDGERNNTTQPSVSNTVAGVGIIQESEKTMKDSRSSNSTVGIDLIDEIKIEIQPSETVENDENNSVGKPTSVNEQNISFPVPGPENDHHNTVSERSTENSQNIYVAEESTENGQNNHIGEQPPENGENVSVGEESIENDQNVPVPQETTESYQNISMEEGTTENDLPNAVGDETTENDQSIPIAEETTENDQIIPTGKDITENEQNISFDEENIENNQNFAVSGETVEKDQTITVGEKTTGNDQNIPVVEEIAENPQNIPISEETPDDQNDQNIQAGENITENEQNISLDKETIENIQNLPIAKKIIENHQNIPVAEEPMEHDQNIPVGEEQSQNNQRSPSDEETSLLSSSSMSSLPGTSKTANWDIELFTNSDNKAGTSHGQDLCLDTWRQTYVTCKICKFKILESRKKIHFMSQHDLRKVKHKGQVHKCKLNGCAAYFLTKNQLERHNKLMHKSYEETNNDPPAKYINGVKYFQCEFCKTTFDSLRSCKRHMTVSNCGIGNSSNSKNEVECVDCKEKFKMNSDLWVHQHQVHSNDKKNVCPKCGKVFNVKQCFKNHMEYHKGPAQWKWECKRCGKKSPKRDELEKHISKMHGTNKRHILKDLVIEHKKEKRSTKNIVSTVKYVCNKCGKWFPKNVLLIKHVEQVHKGVKYSKGAKFNCGNCGRKFRTKMILKKHLETHELIKKLKDTNLAGNKNLRLSIRSKISDEDTKTSRSTEDEDEASKVSMSTDDEDDSTQTSISTGEDDKDSQTSMSTDDEDDNSNYQNKFRGMQKVKCLECPRQFGSQEELLTHRSKSHLEKDWKCEICNIKFYNKQRLAVHMVKHTGEKPYACHICHEMFGHNSSLMRHLKRIHSISKSEKKNSKINKEIMPFQNKWYTVSKTPKQEIDFTCEYCGKEFKRRGNLLNHVAIFHMNKKNGGTKLKSRKKVEYSSDTSSEESSDGEQQKQIAGPSRRITERKNRYARRNKL